MSKSYLVLVFLFCVISACSVLDRPRELEIDGFDPIANIPEAQIDLNFDHAVDSGFTIPAANQFGGNLKVKFNIRNNGSQPKEFFYKIYYQNASYKFPETRIGAISGLEEYNPLCSENFYGSWSDVTTGFKSIGKLPPDDEFHKFSGEIQITGNPRAEKRFIVEEILPPNEDELNTMVQSIRDTPKWFKQEKVKAEEKGITVEEQMEESVRYLYQVEKKKVNWRNDKWKRNPRVGDYEFLLVVTDEQTLLSLPNYVKRIDQTNNGSFINPFYYFLKGEGSKIPNCVVHKSDRMLAIKGSIPLDKGVYVDESKFNQEHYEGHCLGRSCDTTERVKSMALWELYPNLTDPSMAYQTVKEVLPFSQFKMHNYDSFKKEEVARVEKGSQSPMCLGGNVELSESGTLKIKSPGSTEELLQKTNVGIQSRTGLAYGTYTLYLELSELMNDQGMWNGLTHGIKLKNQSNEWWNHRRECKGRGYIPVNASDPESAVPEKTATYAEISFELSKGSHYWPSSSYVNSQYEAPEQEPQPSGAVTVMCSNWDLGCQDPKDFDYGAFLHQKGEQEIELHRWNWFSHSLATKTSTNSNELLGKEFVFQIEWTPKQIIWRMGPEKEDLSVVGFMSDQVTSIPGNQMVLSIAQEFQDLSWMEGTPFEQKNIPFFSEDLVSAIRRVEVE